ncbi:DNA polymerase III subunit beta [Paenibacillus chitinolyticus]|uniref:DNA polymerase III subunit beta n=1 Tax=Paenibacillus chitinolyticus TaxID=79263 RepID=UPI0026E4DD26|nr:DNA polymerase III subunit beta [Paenibacillus chitinolyticus]GKS12860.1 DNA polymerase III subunit beta [Paenibacillus chitinolyticus]
MSALLDLMDQDEMGLETELTEEKVLTFSIEHNQIMNALLTCEKIVPTKGISILQCVKFEIKGSTLFLTSMDMSQSVLQHMTIINESNVNGSFLLPAKEGIKLIKNMPSGSLTFKQENTTIQISYGKKKKAYLSILSSNEYPALPKLKDAFMVEIPFDILQKGAQTETFVLADEAHPNLSSIYLHNEKGRLTFQSTDRHRALQYATDIMIDSQEKEINCLVHAKNFKKIADSFKACDKIEMGFSDDYVVIRNASIIYFTKLIEGKFPDLSPVIRMANDGQGIPISGKSLYESLNRALSLIVENNRVSMEVNEEGKLTLSASNAESEMCEDFEETEVEEDFPLIHFNGRYLRDFLMYSGRNDSSIIKLQVTSGTKPAFFFIENDPTLLYIVNPCR